MPESVADTHARTGRKALKSFALTDRDSALKLARPRGDARYVDHHVKGVGGMVVRVYAGGSRSYMVVKRSPGEPGKPGELWRITVGDVGVMEPDEARDKARALIGKIERGENPRASDSKGATLEDAYRWMLSNNTGIRPATRRNYEGYWKRHLSAKDIAQARMGSIDALWVKARMDAAVSAWVDEKRTIPKPGAGGEEANKLRGMLGKMFADWIAANGGHGTNPVRAVRKFKRGKKRKNKLTIAQARQYLAACERYAAGEGRPGKIPDDPYRKRLRQTAADYLVLTLLVGLRRSNGLGLRWAWINFDAGTITVPADEFKTGNTTNAVDHEFNVPSQALAVLKRRRDDPGRHPEFVFPGRGRNADGPMEEPAKAHAAVLKLAGLPKRIVSIHDLRRTLGSAMIAQGADVSEVREQLGHANIATTSVYLNLSGEGTVRKSLEKAAAAFGGAA